MHTLDCAPLPAALFVHERSPATAASSVRCGCGQHNASTTTPVSGLRCNCRCCDLGGGVQRVSHYSMGRVLCSSFPVCAGDSRHAETAHTLYADAEGVAHFELFRIARIAILLFRIVKLLLLPTVLRW